MEETQIPQFLQTDFVRSMADSKFKHEVLDLLLLSFFALESRPSRTYGYEADHKAL